MLGNRLRELREEKGLTQEELGKRLNLTKANISKYESEKLEPNIETITYLANFFETTADYILGRSNVRQPETQAVREKPTDYEIEDFLRNSNVKFGDAPLDEEDKQDIINFLKIIWNRKKDK